MLHDISLGGIHIPVPPGFQCELREEPTISVVFTLPEVEKALRRRNKKAGLFRAGMEA
jgi:hypothetical protein